MKKFLMSIPMTFIRTAFPNERISMDYLVRMNVKPTNILWGYEGMYLLCPVQHVTAKMHAYKNRANKKAARTFEFDIEQGDCEPLDYQVGAQLARRGK
ncbi:hypothetical protein LCGC14_0343160 [marine sediment metagenome]|uniref:Uncharacterized protein n=1 Tax=marine sediment metagenome TaxID=412755 RepID=A0A0F9WKU8_9ZZZZ